MALATQLLAAVGTLTAVALLLLMAVVPFLLDLPLRPTLHRSIPHRPTLHRPTLHRPTRRDH
jgi:hypothetical protein